MSMCTKFFAAAVLSLAAASTPAMAAHGDTAGLLQALQVERQRAVVEPLPRRNFVLRYAVSAVTLSPDGQQVAWLRERGNHHEVWMQATAGGTPRRMLERTTATDLAWTRDARWLLLESPRPFDPSTERLRIVIKTADYILDLGPEGGVKGGEIVAAGTPEQVVKEKRSFTGQYLAPLLK